MKNGSAFRSPQSADGELKSIHVRLPLALRKELQASADANCRTMVQEIQFRLMRKPGKDHIKAKR